MNCFVTTPTHKYTAPRRAGSGTCRRHHRGCRKKKRIVGYYFGLWVRCLNDELKKKICNCQVPSSALVGGKKRHLSRSAEADTTCGEAGRREKHTPADLRAAAAAEGKHSHTQTPQSRLLPTAGTLRPASCVHFSKRRCGSVTVTQTDNRKDFLTATRSTNVIKHV